jgi:hypothetical protein
MDENNRQYNMLLKHELFEKFNTPTKLQNHGDPLITDTPNNENNPSSVFKLLKFSNPVKTMNNTLQNNFLDFQISQ